MALAVSLRVDFVDKKGKTSFTKIRLPNGFSISDYQQFAVEFVQRLLNGSTGQVTGASICFSLDLSGATLKTTASSVSSVKKKYYVSWDTFTNPFRMQMLIPTASETFEVTGSDAVDDTQPAWSDFSQFIANGLTPPSAPIRFTNGRNMQVAAPRIEKFVFRRRRSG